MTNFMLEDRWHTHRASKKSEGTIPVRRVCSRYSDDIYDPLTLMDRKTAKEIDHVDLTDVY